MQNIATIAVKGLNPNATKGAHKRFAERFGSHWLLITREGVYALWDRKEEHHILLKGDEVKIVSGINAAGVEAVLTGKVVIGQKPWSTIIHHEKRGKDTTFEQLQQGLLKAGLTI